MQVSNPDLRVRLMESFLILLTPRRMEVWKPYLRNHLTGNRVGRVHFQINLKRQLVLMIQVESMWQRVLSIWSLPIRVNLRYQNYPQLPSQVHLSIEVKVLRVTKLTLTPLRFWHQVSSEIMTELWNHKEELKHKWSKIRKCQLIPQITIPKVLMQSKSERVVEQIVKSPKNPLLSSPQLLSFRRDIKMLAYNQSQ